MEQRPLYEQRLWSHYHVIYEKSLHDVKPKVYTRNPFQKD